MSGIAKGILILFWIFLVFSIYPFIFQQIQLRLTFDPFVYMIFMLTITLSIFVVPIVIAKSKKV